MCGINGFLSFGNSIDNGKAFVDGMNTCISHRGPDDKGYWATEDRKLHFGHLRLSIIDLSPAGHQPMITATGTAIVFNGEIYNFNELREKYFKGLNFNSTSDTEILLLLYEKFGESCVDFLNGMFAFAIWNSQKKELFIARDRSGKKPFYYSFSNGKFSFSSELKALLTLPWIDRKLDDQSLYHFLTFNMLAPPQTMFEGINKLAAGHTLTISQDGSHRSREFWEVHYDSSISTMDESELVDLVNSSLKKAVDYRMVSDVPVGAFLSGGVDSSAIVALMSQKTNIPINTFSVGFDGQQNYDERYYAAKVAAMFKTNHEEIIVTANDIEQFLPKVVDIFDEPLADETCIPIYFLSQKARSSGSIVVMTGDGSDELFAGYRNWKKYIRMAPWYENYSKMPMAVRQLILSGGKLLKPNSNVVEMLSRSAKGQDFFWLGARSFKEATKSKFLNDGFRNNLIEKDSYSVIAEYKKSYEKARLASGRKFNYTDWMCYLGFKYIVPNYYLSRMDRLGMANSIEIRSPFLDYEFVNMALSISSKHKLVHDEPKYILKKSLEKILPAEILYRKKMGFCVPIREWSGEIMIDYIDKNLKVFCEMHPQFRYSELNNLLQQLKSGKETSVNKLWTMYFLIAWFKRWFD